MAQPNLSARLAVRDYPRDLTPVMDQKWRNLLFLHWEYDAEAIQKTLPQGLFVDTFEGKAYIGITPFALEGVKPKLFPPLPGMSNFFELNCRTYVYDEAGVPGVWFYSLDANQQLVVQMARQFMYLPYRYTPIEMSLDPRQAIHYQCEPLGTRVEFIYKGEGPIFLAEPGSLEFFLIERYVLFADKGDRLTKGRIHHVPYPLNQAKVPKWDSQLFELNGFDNPQRPPDHLVFSPGVDVEIFSLQDKAKKSL